MTLSPIQTEQMFFTSLAPFTRRRFQLWNCDRMSNQNGVPIGQAAIPQTAAH